MKKIAVACVLLTSSLFAGLDWIDTYKAGMAKALQEKKLVMVILTKEGCPACEYMEDIVFEEDALTDEINKDFVSIHFDVNNDYVPQNLRYIGTPTLYFLTEEGKKIERLDGGANVKDFLELIRDVKSKGRR